MNMTYEKIDHFNLASLKVYAVRGELFVNTITTKSPKKIVNVVNRCACSDEVKSFSFGCGCYTPERLENLVRRGMLLHGTNTERFKPSSENNDSTVRVEFSVTADELKKVSDALIEAGISFKVTPNE